MLHKTMDVKQNKMARKIMDPMNKIIRLGISMPSWLHGRWTIFAHEQMKLKEFKFEYEVLVDLMCNRSAVSFALENFPEAEQQLRLIERLCAEREFEEVTRELAILRQKMVLG